MGEQVSKVVERNQSVDEDGNPARIEWASLYDSTWRLEHRDTWRFDGTIDVDATIEKMVEEDKVDAIFRGQRGTVEAVLTIGTARVMIYIRMGSISMHVLCRETDEMDAAMAVVKQFREIFKPEEKTDDTIKVNFWNNGRHGPHKVGRRIEAPTWDEIKGNYGAESLRQLDALITKPSPGAGGKLILWHGLPGTGKTYAIRAMAREWSKWCEINYIIDPEAFFTDGDYMMGLLLQEEEQEWDPIALERVAVDRWKLLIFEDSGELLSPDAKEKVGQGLSRLLNIVDGMIGQGLKVLLLITTNEELGRLHPAVTRPGRCAANIGVSEFTSEEAEAWAKQHNVAEWNGEKTLAELYGLAAGRKTTKKVRRTVGFGA
jgi:hypothetical protein